MVVAPRAMFPHKTVAVGGTFDILHYGHERLLARAFELGETVFVGISGDRLVSRLDKNHPVRSFRTRESVLKRFLRAHGWLQRARIVELKDPFGPAAKRRRLEALVVSKSTLPSGRRANSIRRGRRLPLLRLYAVPLVKAEDGVPISVTRIRRGEIDARGRRLKCSSTSAREDLRTCFATRASSERARSRTRRPSTSARAPA
jgi:pantetheine-phosphate adenylyltransferase